MKKDSILRIDNYKYYLLILFIVIQPLLDIYYLYTDKVVNIIGFSPSTIIRVCITAILAILTLITLKDRKSWGLIVTYLSLVLIYSIFHFINANKFHSLVPGNFNYSMSGEIFYIVRMLIPISIIFITVSTKVSIYDFEKAIKIIILLISGSIVLMNIFKVSLGSYTNEVIKDNIFGWFKDAYVNYNYSSLASKGLFNFANQIAALLVLLLPIILVIYTKKYSIYNLVLIILTIVAMVMLGTKVALYGAIIDIGIYILAILFMRIFKKENLLSKQVLVMASISVILLGVLYPKSPSVNRELVAKWVRINNSKVEREHIENNVEKDKVSSKEDIKSQDNEKEEIDNEYKKLSNNGNDKVRQHSYSNKQEMIEYIEKNYKKLMIGEKFITKSYPYKYDPEFWIDIINLPAGDRLNWRGLQQKMLQRVMDINDNPNDKWLGMSFTRTQNIFNLERDFISQYYSMGILGVILLLLCPYVLIVITCFIKILLKFREKFNLFNSMTCFAILFAIGVSLYSGNIMDTLTVTIILAFILGTLINSVFYEDYIYKKR